MLITDYKIEEYIHANISGEDNLLSELNRKTHLDIVQPRMLSGHLQGKILEMISMMIKPHYVLEIGTFTGYSALCLAKGLQKNGKLFTLEINDELEEMARSFFQRSQFGNQIELIIGDACDIIGKLENKFDLVFIDGDKKEYTTYFNLVYPLLNPGGFILADNVLWDGKVTEVADKYDDDTKSIQDFNKMILNNDNVENVILPVRDGINIIRKK